MSDFLNNDDILERNDGRKCRDLQFNFSSNSDTLERNETPGFLTRIHCRWCNSLIKEVYIPALKKGKNGKPCSIVFDYEPCKNCRETWNEYVVFIEVNDDEPYDNCLPIYEDTVPIKCSDNPTENEIRALSNRIVRDEWVDSSDGKIHVLYENKPWYPTGRYVGVTLSSIENYLDPADKEQIHKGSVIFLQTSEFAEAFDEHFVNNNL